MNHNAYTRQLLTIFATIPEDKRDRFIGNYSEQARNPTLILGFNIWLGWLGVDRFLLGQPLLGVLKLVTLGGLGVWNFIDHFLVGGVAREKNIDIARSIAASL
jgi:TM2 domain-containing membrane protein YozV